MSRQRKPPLPDCIREDAERYKRGAQLGNTNALKHGFYARAFHLRENRDLEKYKFFGLTDEIRLMRVYIRRILETDTSTFSPAENLAFWRAFSLAMLALTRLVRTDKLIEDPNDDVSYAILQAADDLRRDLEAQNEAESRAKEKEKTADSSFPPKPLFPSAMNTPYG